MTIEIVNFRKYEKNTLKGFFTAKLPKIFLEIRDCSLHQKDGKYWVNLPSKPYKDEEGNQKWSYIIKFTEKKIYERFQEEILGALQLDQGQEESQDQDTPF